MTSVVLFNHVSLSRFFSFVVIVHTSPDHFEFRQVIRQTWGSAEVLGPMGAFVIFILGRSNDLRVEQRIREEWKTFGDILQTGDVGDD